MTLGRGCWGKGAMSPLRGRPASVKVTGGEGPRRGRCGRPGSAARGPPPCGWLRLCEVTPPPPAWSGRLRAGRATELCWLSSSAFQQLCRPAIRSPWTWVCASEYRGDATPACTWPRRAWKRSSRGRLFFFFFNISAASLVSRTVLDNCMCAINTCSINE